MSRTWRRLILTGILLGGGGAVVCCLTWDALHRALVAADLGAAPTVEVPLEDGDNLRLPASDSLGRSLGGFTGLVVWLPSCGSCSAAWPRSSRLDVVLRDHSVVLVTQDPLQRLSERYPRSVLDRAHVLVAPFESAAIERCSSLGPCFARVAQGVVNSSSLGLLEELK